MSDINHVVLVGRLTKDMELAYLQSGSAIGTFSLAVGRTYKDGKGQKVDDVSYIDVKLFGKVAETLKQFLTKGKQIAVTGSIKQDRWEKDGQKHSKISILANTVQLLGGKSEGSQNPTGAYKKKENETPQETFEADGFPEEIPF